LSQREATPPPAKGSHRGRLLWKAALLAAGLALTGVGIVSAYAGHRLSRPRRRYGEGEPPDGSYEEVTFTSTDGLRIRGWFLPASRGVDGVILCHGFLTGRREMLPLALELRERGHHVLLFDFRGHGGSEGDRSSCGILEVHDLEGAVQYLAARPEMEGKRLGVVGFSMGAAVAIAAAARVPAIEAVVSDSSFAIFEEVINTGFPAMYRLPAFPFAPLALRVAERLVGVCAGDNRPLDVIAAIAPRPVLLIHGTADTMIPVTEALMLQAAAGDGTESWIVDGASHVGARLLDFQAYLDRVDRFLKLNLS
jgi:uncharacterized protein